MRGRARSGLALPPDAGVLNGDQDEYGADIVIIGSGMGGGTLAYALRASGAKVLLVERGDFLRAGFENFSSADVLLHGGYRNAEPWVDALGNEFQSMAHYYVGGNTKFYGACLARLREQDFQQVEHLDGTSPAWPFGYWDLEPYYTKAEQLYRVHGAAGADPHEPARSEPYPYGPLEHEPYIAELAETLRNGGTRPYPLPIGVDRRPGGRCVLCDKCDGFPCAFMAKSDAETRAVRPALAAGGVELLPRTFVARLVTDRSGRKVVAAEARRDGRTIALRGGTFVISAGAVNSAALLLRSASSAHPEGLANSSGLVGRNYMAHNHSDVTAVHPRRHNPVVFQKTLGINDFYFSSDRSRYPLGNIQLRGKLEAAELKRAIRRAPATVLDSVTRRSVDWWLISEDLPSQDNRVVVRPDGRTQVRWRPTNGIAHKRLVSVTKSLMREAGYPVVLHRPCGVETTDHQCGTVVAGTDPARSVLDPHCRSHDVPNLFVVDASFFPSSAATNPSLTIAAQALRVAEEALTA